MNIRNRGFLEVPLTTKDTKIFTKETKRKMTEPVIEIKSVESGEL